MIRQAPEVAGDGRPSSVSGAVLPAHLLAIPVRLGDTRRRILFVASHLFARQGYAATSTRQIADLVGIRQPSLFHHFESKAAIARELLDYDLDACLPLVEALAAEDGPAADRLYRHLRHDVAHLAGAPYNLGGLYMTEVTEQPGFETYRRRHERLHRAQERIIDDGQQRGEFIGLPARFVREAITGILLRTAQVYGGSREPAPPGFADDVASLVLRSLLVDPSRLDELRSGVRDLGERVAAPA